MNEDIKPLVEHIDLTLLANFTHQVINPLNGVAGTLDNLCDGTINEGRREQRTRAARAQLEGVITLVRNLAYLASTRFDSSQATRTIVLPQIIIKAAMYYQEEGESKGIRIDLLNSADQNKAPGHPEVLRQVLMNLFDNAVKYSATNSRVEIKQSVQKRTCDAMITVRSVPSRPIQETNLERLFEMGFRGENAKAMVASGTGLGLFICRYLMEQRMGGSLTAQNDRGGILFVLRFPNGRTE